MLGRRRSRPPQVQDPEAGSLEMARSPKRKLRPKRPNVSRRKRKIRKNRTKRIRKRKKTRRRKNWKRKPNRRGTNVQPLPTRFRLVWEGRAFTFIYIEILSPYMHTN
jgi:hypothetical protein